MFAFKFEYAALMFEAISHFEHHHFCFLKHLVDVDGKKVPWKLDFLYIIKEDFPDLGCSMAPINLDALGTSVSFRLVPWIFYHHVYFLWLILNSFRPFSHSNLYDYLMDMNHISKNSNEDFVRCAIP